MMNVRYLSSALLLSLFVAFGGCGGTGAESDLIGITDSDPAVFVSDETDGKTSDHASATLAGRNGEVNLVECPYLTSRDGTWDGLIYPDCDGGGGGGGGGTSTPPATDTSLSYLNASARGYLSQMGVPNVEQVGGTLWVDGCTAAAYQGAVTFNSGVSASCTYGPPPGWIIVDYRYEVQENLNRRGTYSVSLINGSVTTSSTTFGSKFNGAINLAVKAGDLSASGKLQLEYQRIDGYSFAFSGIGQNIYVYVKANGGLFKASRIVVATWAKLLRVY